MGIPVLHSYGKTELILLGRIRDVLSVKSVVFDLVALVPHW